MPHVAIVGMTTSGKSTLAKRFCADFRRAGVPTLCLHKPHEPYPAAWQTDDPEKFLAKVDRSRGCAVFMEISDANADKFDVRFHRLFTAGRHLGHRCFFVSQRAAQVHPNIRENCEWLYLFMCAPSAAKIWCDEFADEGIMQAPKLPRYAFLKVGRYAPASQHWLLLR